MKKENVLETINKMSDSIIYSKTKLIVYAITNKLKWRQKYWKKNSNIVY